MNVAKQTGGPRGGNQGARRRRAKGGSKMVKLSVNLSQETVDALEALASKRGLTMTEVIRRAIADAKYFDESVEAGSKILIEDRSHKQRELIFR